MSSIELIVCETCKAGTVAAGPRGPRPRRATCPDCTTELIAEARDLAAVSREIKHGAPSHADMIDALADALEAAGRASRKVEVTDEDIQRGVKIALGEGLAGRTWPEYIRAVYNAVSTRPTP